MGKEGWEESGSKKMDGGMRGDKRRGQGMDGEKKGGEESGRRKRKGRKEERREAKGREMKGLLPVLIESRINSEQLSSKGLLQYC